MNQKVAEIVEGYRSQGISVLDEETEYVEKLCNRKMELSKIENREEYLPLMFADELRNYLVRTAVNATSILRMMGKENI